MPAVMHGLSAGLMHGAGVVMSDRFVEWLVVFTDHVRMFDLNYRLGDSHCLDRKGFIV